MRRKRVTLKPRPVVRKILKRNTFIHHFY